MKQVCRVCKTEKDLTDFARSKNNKSGFKTICKCCNHAQVMEWRAKNPDKVAKIRARSHARNYAKNREKILARAKARFAAMPKKGRKVSPNSGAYYETLKLAQSPERPDKEEFALASSDDGISLAAAISLLKMKPHMKVLALAIIGAGSGGADRHYLMETVCSTGNYNVLKTAIFWLRRHLIGTGMKLENAGYGRGYRIVFEVTA